MPRVHALILCAGSSQRFGQDKLLLSLAGVPVWKRSFDAFANHPEVGTVLIVAHQGLMTKVPGAVLGGSSRIESVQRGLAALQADPDDLVLVHDGARPLVSADLISRCIAEAKVHGTACPSLPITDSLKSRDGRHFDRDSLVAVQTPQCAKYKLLVESYRNAPDSATDDMGVLEANGIEIQLIPGDKSNLKITTEEDYALAQFQLGARTVIRTGFGYDIHPFSTDPDRKLWLGGVCFEDAPALDGHSDADVLLHAVVDALLGAVGMGDIGQLFPNTDPTWKNASSMIFLREAGKRLADDNWTISNIDITVVSELPKVMPRSSEIRATIAKELNLDPQQVNLKATTNEKLGAIGRSEGIATMATATVVRIE